MTPGSIFLMRDDGCMSRFAENVYSSWGVTAWLRRIMMRRPAMTGSNGSWLAFDILLAGVFFAAPLPTGKGATKRVD